MHVFECDFERQRVISHTLALFAANIFIFEGVFVEFLQPGDFLFQVAVLRLKFDILAGKQIIEV